MQSFDVRSLTLETSVSLVAPLTALADHAFPEVDRYRSRVVGCTEAFTVMTLYSDGRLYVSGQSFDDLLANRSIVSDRLQTDGLINEAVPEGRIATGLVDFDDAIETSSFSRLEKAKLSSDGYGTTIEFVDAATVELRFVGINNLLSLDTNGSVTDVRKTLQALDKAYRNT